jgi:hypothetical protein
MVLNTQRYDYELLNEDGWQLMVYRPGTLKVKRLSGYDQGAEGDCLYAVTHDTKRIAMEWVAAYESGEETFEPFPKEPDADTWIPTGYDRS